MRLIDADELTKDRVENDPVRIAAMCAPTAYKPDKVVERLKSQKSGLTAWAEDEAFKLGIEIAIEIVKSGGIERNRRLMGVCRKWSMKEADDIS